MTATVRTLPPNARVQDAVIEFTRGRYRHLPVLEGDRLVGIVSDRDVLRVVASESHDPNGPISSKPAPALSDQPQRASRHGRPGHPSRSRRRCYGPPGVT